MKKITCVLTVIALAGVMLCFAACGGETAKQDMTSAEDEITSIVDDVTSMAENLGDMLTENGNVTDSTEEGKLESFVEDMTEDTTDVTDVTDDKNVSGSGAAAE